MPARLSIVIATLDAARVLPDCLEALMEGLGQGLIRELIVSDGGSRDGTIAIARAAGARVLTGAPSRGGQLRRGCAAAKGAWLLILHADTVPAPGWARVVASHLGRPGGGPAYFRLAFDTGGAMARFVAGWANLRAGVFGLPYGDQGLLVSRCDYDTAGGYPDLPLMEDVALVRKLGVSRALPVRATTSAERYLRDGWMRRGAGNLWTLTRYFAGADPHRLAARYRR